MPPQLHPQTILTSAHISPEIFTLRPSYRALLLIVQNIPPGPSDSTSDALLQQATETAKSTLASTTPLTSLPHIAAWRDTYKAFGSKPAKFRNSLESLMRRVDGSGLPRVNRLTDIYNAISIKYQIPVGGEDLDAYVGAPFLTLAKGTETFQTLSGGEGVSESPDKGEVVWCDDEGVTCRRWNWRQCARTGLSEGTRNVLFILDALEPCSDEVLEGAADELESVLKGLGEGVVVSRRVLRKE